MTEMKIDLVKNKHENQIKEKSGIELNVQISYVNPKTDSQKRKALVCFISNFCITLVLFFISLVLLILAAILWSRSSNINDTTNKTYLEISSNRTPVDNNTSHPQIFEIVSRYHWLAQPPVEQIETLQTPISLVIIHHTATSPCLTKAQCVLQTRHIQEFHIESKKWSDIGYNFLIGGDGKVYEGRGWTKQGAHTLHYNNQSIGVGFIGTFTVNEPPEHQVKALHNILEKGVELRYLADNYKIMGANQLSKTASPGKALVEVMKAWNHWIENLN